MERMQKTRLIDKRWYANFKCVCGCVVERRHDNTAKSCGCINESRLLKNRELPSQSNFTLLEPLVNQKTKVLVRCICGNEYSITPSSLFNNDKATCIKCRNLKGDYSHIGGLRNHPAYNVLDGMKQRCYNTSSKAYYWYGAIGITICDEWRNSYVAFCVWADSSGYTPEMTIDRIDVNAGYSPGNCRWVSKLDQRENKHTQKNNTSGFTGVSFNKKSGKYESYYTLDQVKYRCGYFKTAAEAYEARVAVLKTNNINYNREGKIND